MTARLRPELFALVLEHVARSLKNPRPFLIACSLLDRSYGQEAQRILFKRCLERLEISADAGYFDPLRRKMIGTLRLDSLTSLIIGGDVHESLLFSLHKYCTRLTHLDITRNGESTDPVRAYDLVRASSKTLTSLSWRQHDVPTPPSLQRFTQEVSILSRLTYFQLDGPICECCYYALVVALPPTLETLAFRTEEHDILADLLQGTVFFKEVFGGTLTHPVIPNLKLLVLPKTVKRLLPEDVINGAAKRGITLRFTRPKPSD
ncbi:hypothetical protein JCM10296v2_005048 [Rhodotorula toruloides]